MTLEPAVPADTEELLRTWSAAERFRNGVPDERAAADRESCLRHVRQVLADHLSPDGVRASALGTAWTDVFEAVLYRRVDPALLSERGWLALDGGGGAASTWMVVENGYVLGGVRLRSVNMPEADDELATVLARCRTRREVRLREVLELRELRRQAVGMPAASRVLQAAADVESGLGGRLLAPWASGRIGTPPVRLPGPGGRRSRRRLVVAISGVDGSGKTTLRAAVGHDFERAGVQTSTVWVRPGMGLGPLVRVAQVVKRLLRQEPGPGIRAVAADPGSAALRSRSGLVGWLWALLVVVSFLQGVWRQHVSARGVVLYDRHLVDALATLDFAYQGADLRLHRLLVRWLLPRADVSVYLDVPEEISVARKPDDLVGAAAVRSQLERYRHWLGTVSRVHRIDATQPPEQVRATVRRLVALQLSSRAFQGLGADA